MNSSLFDVPSIEIFLKRGEAARIAVGHLEHVLTQAPNTPELAEPAALAVLYATVSEFPYVFLYWFIGLNSCLYRSASSSVPRKSLSFLISATS